MHLIFYSLLYPSQSKKKHVRRFLCRFFLKNKVIRLRCHPYHSLNVSEYFVWSFWLFYYLKSLSYDKSNPGNFVLSFRNILFSICIKCLFFVNFFSLFFTVGESLIFLQLTFYFIGTINQKYPRTKFSLSVAIVMGIKWLYTFPHSVAALSSLESRIFITRLFGLTDRGVHYPCIVSVIACQLIFLHNNWAVSVNF